MRKAFTLVEILAVIILLGIIGLIVYPSVTGLISSNQEKIYKSQLHEIELAAEKWAYSNMDSLPEVEDSPVPIFLINLKESGFIPLDFRNSKTKKLFPNDMVINITLKNNKYIFKVLENSGTNVEGEFNVNSPVIALNGNYIEYIELNSIYNELGATAKNKDGESISVNIQYKHNDTEIPNITTNQYKTFTVIYSATSGGYTSNIVRTLVVRDTTPPTLTIPADMIISVTELNNLNLLSGVTVTDNSGEVISVNTSGFDRLPGKKIVSYKACDSNNNCTTKKRIINILTIKVTLTNLIKNGSFEQDISGWANSYNTVLSSGNSGYVGQKSICATNTDSTQLEGYFHYTTDINYISGHKYYSQVYVKSETVTTQIYFPLTPPYPQSVLYPGSGWIMNSLYVENTDIDTGNYYYRLDIDNNKTVANACYDAIILVDLTDAFGPGQEPTKEWCDNNIKYFEGTKVLTY